MSKARMMYAAAGGTQYGVLTSINQGGGDKKQGLVSTTNTRVQLNNYIRTHGGGHDRNLIFCMNQLGGVGRRWGQASGPGNRGGVSANCQRLAYRSRMRNRSKPMGANVRGWGSSRKFAALDTSLQLDTSLPPDASVPPDPCTTLASQGCMEGTKGPCKQDLGHLGVECWQLEGGKCPAGTIYCPGPTPTPPSPTPTPPPEQHAKYVCMGGAVQDVSDKLNEFPGALPLGSFQGHQACGGITCDTPAGADIKYHIAYAPVPSSGHPVYSHAAAFVRGAADDAGGDVGTLMRCDPAARAAPGTTYTCVGGVCTATDDNSHDGGAAGLSFGQCQATCGGWIRSPADDSTCIMCGFATDTPCDGNRYLLGAQVRGSPVFGSQTECESASYLCVEPPPDAPYEKMPSCRLAYTGNSDDKTRWGSYQDCVNAVEKCPGPDCEAVCYARPEVES